VPRRPEIAAEEFASSVECRLLGQIAFDAATFGTAANNGQMIAEVAANHRSNDTYRTIGMHVTGRTAPEKAAGKTSFKLPSFLKKRA
jgi:pilus assembly protein CpaE